MSDDHDCMCPGREDMPPTLLAIMDAAWERVHEGVGAGELAFFLMFAARYFVEQCGDTPDARDALAEQLEATMKTLRLMVEGQAPHD